MNLTPMSYKDYVWPFNPESIKIERSRYVAEFKIPQRTGAVQDSGSAPRIVTGSGRFVGSSSADEFSQLSSVFADVGSGTLRLPGMAPFQAVFASLVMKGQARPGCIGYEFTFLEDTSAASKDGDNFPQIYVCSGGESLWDIANRYGTTVDALHAANPQIEWPNALASGEKVTIA